MTEQFLDRCGPTGPQPASPVFSGWGENTRDGRSPVRRADVGSVFEQMGGEGMAQHVRRHALVHAGAFRGEFDRVLESAYMIDLTIKEEVYVIEYLPALGFGVSRQKTATFGWEGVEHSFSSEEEVETFVGTLSGSTLQK